jgi:hypothetical protein
MVWLCLCYAHLVGRCVQAFGPAFFQMNVLNSAVDDIELISENRLKSVRQQFLFWFFGELCVLQGVPVASIMEGLKPDL